MQEKWCDIVGYEGYYQISSMGNVRSLPRQVKSYGNRVLYRKGRLMTLGIQSKGYTCVKLSKEGIERTLTVHKLVATAFIPNTDGKPQVNHIDGDKSNNQVDNLEWCTMDENIDHALLNGLIDKEEYSKKVTFRHARTGVVLEFKSLSEAERHGFHRRSIKDCLKGRYKTYKGYSIELV